MKNLVLKLSLTGLLLTSFGAPALSQQAFGLNNTGPNSSIQGAFQNANLPGFCGDNKTDEGEQCDNGTKNGDRCSSCASDCRLQWMPADCEDAPPVITIDVNQLRLNNPVAEHIGEIFQAAQDNNVNHTTMAPPPVGTANIPPPLEEETETPTPTADAPADTVEVPTAAHEAAGGCSFVELVNAPGSLGQVLVLGLSLIPLAAIRRRKY